MADDGEIDIEGDFELKLESDGGVGYDLNELPSKSANLLPEFTNPPWMLEQGWSLDACLDEKSKATIEKMLLEEQNYLNGRMTIPKSPLKWDERKGSTHKKPWTEEEKQIFVKGLEIYGRSWTKIAELIPSRTSLQVKNYAQQHFKQQNKLAEGQSKAGQDSLGKSSVPSSISAALASVTTAQPTIQTGLLSKALYGRTSNNFLSNGTTIYQDLRNISNSGLFHLSPSPDGFKVLDSMLLTPDASAPESLFSPSGSSTSDHPGEEEEVDIDIENDDDVEDNPILLSRSASPSSVYEALLKSANIRTRRKGGSVASATSTDGSSGEVRGEEEGIGEETEDCPMILLSTDPTDNNAQKDVGSNDTEEKHRSESSPALLEDYDRDSPTDLNSTSRNLDMEKSFSNTIVSSNGEVIELSVPIRELVLERHGVTEQEKRLHSEFFDGRPSKTPQRYLRIRNYILDSWFRCKPEYLNKTSVRPGLKNCGDVNCIGRIHSYLELAGAINFGCELACYNRPAKTVTCVQKEKPTEDKLAMCVEKMEAMRPRKRKIRDPFGFWIDERDAEGKTIEHNSDSQEMSLYMKTPRLNKYDPFKLIPCCTFDEKMPPFSVEVDSTALTVMDLHAHVSKTEVIGLLGGSYRPDRGRLIIARAMPCNSISTGMQCEMDPVSQTIASEKISSAGLCIVGWYHSHPTFAPNPSVRDLETQLKFQDWFSKGGSNFVGVIVNPYKRSGSTLQSEFCCLTVSDETSQSSHCNIPYQFEFDVAMDTFSSETALQSAKEIRTQHCENSHRVDLLSTYRAADNITCLDKLLQSIQSYLLMESEGATSFLSCIRDMFGQRFSTDDLTVCIKEDEDLDFSLITEDTDIL